MGRLPCTIDTIGHWLHTLLDNATTGYKRLVLVGHSRGGLVIQAIIFEQVKTGKVVAEKP